MTGLVQQLLSDAMDQSVPLGNLLRKVKLAAVRLKLADAIEWVDAELCGYDGVEVPEYRKVYGVLKARNPYHGWSTVAGDADTIELLSARQVGESVSALEDLVKGGDAGTLMLRLPQRVVSQLIDANPGCNDVAVFIGATPLVSILDRVRSQVFDWALNLERAGITGEGLTFSTAELARAEAAHISIGSFSGNLNTGNISGENARANLGSTDQSQNTSSSSVFVQIENALNEQAIDQTERDALLALLSEMKANQGKSSYLSAYQKFIAAAANHMTLLAPFLPALASQIPAN